MMSRHDGLRDMAKLAGVDRDPNLMALVDSPILPDDKRAKLAKYLRSLVAQNCPRPHSFLPAPTRQEAQAGTVPLGRVITGRNPEYMHLLKREEASGGILLAAPPGGGKTVLLAHMGLAFHRQGVPVWWYDSEGDLTAYIVKLAPDVLLPDYRVFRQELFEPSPQINLEWGEYLSKVISSMRAPLFMGDGMANMARNIATEVRERLGHVTPFEFLAELQRRKHRLSSREGNYYEALRNRFEGMILPALGPTYGGGSHDMAAMLRQSLVWQLQGLADDILSFFITELLLAVSLIRPVGPGMHLESLQVCDEFTRFCSLEHMRRATAGEIFMLDFARTCRKRGIGLVVATQTPHLLPPQILSDMNTWIVFRPTDGRFLQCVSQALSLNPDQEDALMELPDRQPRQAVVRTAGFPNPFLIEVPQYQTEWATPQELDQRREQTKAWLDSIYTPPVRTRTPPSEQQPPATPLFTPREHPLSKPLLDYLVFCAQDWAMSVTARDKKHDISPGVGNRHRKGLADEGLLRLHRILTGRRGGQLQVTEITEEGYRVLEQFDVRVPRPPGRGGFEHRLWQSIVHAWAVRQGYPAQIEQEVAGKPVDVGVVWDERRVAVEIVVEGIEKELDNLGKDLDRGWDQVVFCAVSQETLDSLRERVRETFGEDPFSQGRISFRRLYEFLEAGPSSRDSGSSSEEGRGDS